MVWVVNNNKIKSHARRVLRDFFYLVSVMKKVHKCLQGGYFRKLPQFLFSTSAIISYGNTLYILPGSSYKDALCRRRRLTRIFLRLSFPSFFCLCCMPPLCAHNLQRQTTVTTRALFLFPLILRVSECYECLLSTGPSETTLAETK